MEIDDALRRANPLGRTQVLLMTVTGLFATEVCFLILSSVFIAEIPPHHCAVCDNCTINDTIPVHGDGTYYECEEYADVESGNDTQGCSDGWEYDSKLYGESIVSEWDLVCDKASFSGLAQSTMLLGFGLGSVFAGGIADKYGRRRITLVSLLVFNALGVAVSFSPNFVTFVTLRFAAGFVFRGTHIPPLITLMEFLTPEYRPIFGNVPGIVYAFAAMLMSIIAFLIRDWRFFNMALMTPSILAMGVIWCQPESVRWLIAQGDNVEAEKWMQKVAKFNRVEDFPRPALKQKATVYGTTSTDQETEEEVGDGDSMKKSSSFVLLFKRPTIMVTLVLSWLWISYSLIYFGFALSTGTLAGDPYVNFFLSSLVELPARIIPLPIVKRYGNLWPTIIFYSLAGICMIAIIAIPRDAGNGYVVTSFALLGKFLIVCTFPPLNLLNAGLFPTNLRTAGTGIAQLIGNIGSVTSPILLYLDNFIPNLSFMVMTGAAFLSALLCLLLPETRGCVQPDTVGDLKHLFDTRRIITCQRKSSDETGLIESENDDVSEEQIWL